MQLHIEGDAALIADFRDFPGRTTRAMVRALNRALVSGRTVMVRAMAGDVGLRQTAVRTALRQRDATFQRPSAELGASLKRIPLIQFNARGPEPSRGRGRVTYKLGASRGHVPGAFIATMGSGHRGVFTRRTRQRLPIQELFGPSLGRVFAKYRPQVLEAMHASFLKNFDHELRFQQAQGGGDAGTD